MKLQALATSILVACGVALMVSSWSAWESLKTARDHYYNHYQFADLFGGLKRAPESLGARLRNLNGIDRLETRVVSIGLVSLQSASSKQAPAVGEFVSLPSIEGGSAESQMNRLHLRKGRLPIPSSELEVAVHESFALANHLVPGDRLVIQVEGARKQARVVGIAISPEFVYALSPLAPLPDDLHFGVFWLAREELEALAGMQGAFNSVIATLRKDATPEVTRALLESELRIYGSSNVILRPRQLSNQFVEDEIRQQKVTALFFPAVFLSVAAFIIHVITSRIITLHRSQIGTLKALGYSDFRISRHYAVLVLMLTSLGILPGMALGGLIGAIQAASYKNFFKFPSIDFSLQGFALAFGFLAGILPGLVGGAASVRAVASLRPAEAMRPSIPLQFAGGLRFPEKWGFSARTRMGIRTLFSRPFRLALSVVGLSTAVALLVMSGAWTDMISHLIFTQFSMIQREDIGVGFTRPVRPSSLRELLNYPGVLQVEGMRSVSGRLRYRHRVREVIVTGWPDLNKTRSLRQMADLRFDRPHVSERRISPRQRLGEGVVLSRAFAERWKISPGDHVTLELLAGHYPTQEFQVRGFSDDRMGLSVSLPAGVLNRLLDEPEVFSEALLKVDPRLRTSLYLKLRDSPVIASVVLKDELVRGFRSTVAAIVRISTLILTSFAMAIAVAILGNSVRVNYSERLWELASLRVLGFSRRQTFELFASEIFSQLLVALIPGCFLGLLLVRLSMLAIHTESIGFPVIVFASTYARAVLFCLVIAVLGVALVWRMIRRIDLATALKSRD